MAGFIALPTIDIRAMFTKSIYLSIQKVYANGKEGWIKTEYI